MAKRKRKKRQVGRKEYLFNVLSILIMIGFAIFIGYRSIYYYSKQNNKKEAESSTLKAAVIAANRVTKKENGLHQDKSGYYFKGIVDNNYVSLFNRLFRIVRVNNDNSVLLVSNNNEAVFDFGDSSEYLTSNIYKWLNKTDSEHSGIYYDTFSGVETLLKKTNYCIPVLKDEKVECEESKNSYFYPMSLDDYVLAGGKNSFLNTNENTYLLGYNENNENLYITDDGSVEGISNFTASGIKVMFSLKNDTKLINGTGTLNDPYIIDQQGQDTYVNKYVDLDGDIYRIYESGDILRLISTDYIKVRDKYYEGAFSNYYGVFNPLNRGNIAYYLNSVYYNTLPYKSLLEECEFYIGEVSDRDSVDYEKIYSEVISNKIGLPNMYDYNNTKKLNDFYLINTIQNLSKNAHVYDSSGIIKDDSVTEKRNVVVTACLNKNTITSGNGTMANPYKVR